MTAKRQAKIVAVFLIMFFSLRGQALTWSDEFTSLANVDSYDMKYNSATGTFYPEVQIQGWNAGSGAQVTSLDMGDGSHGSFDSSTWANFGSVNGTTITIDTDTYYPLQVTSFTLDLGYTLKGVGSNPLDIRSLTDITIAGTLDCNGEAGEGINANNTVVSAGGSGNCGGGAGGSGGAIPAVEATDGTMGGASLTRAGLGANAANAAPAMNNVGATGGGGGGAYSQAGTQAEDGYDVTETTWNSKGGNFQDDGFTVIGGGSGGGGGMAYSGTDGANHSSGGAGGGGGGVVLLRAVRDITISGAVNTNGGAGGGTALTYRAGGGGAGGGGTVGVWAGRNLSFTGTINANGGTGGESGIDDADAPSGNFPNQGKGGDGGEGRTGITDNDKCDGATCPGTENPAFLGIDEGRVRSVITTYTITSKEIDLRNTAPVLNSVTVSAPLSGGSTVAVEIATSDQTGFDPTSLWAASATFVGQPMKRFVRYRLTVDNQDADNPAVVDSITFDYDGHQQDQFDFTANCGTIAAGSGPLPPGPTALLVLMCLLLPLGSWIYLREV